MRTRLAAALSAVLVAGALPWAACAHAQAAPSFEVIPRRIAERPSHRLAWITAIAGVGLVAGSFPLSADADRRYELYLRETDISRIDERFRATERMDRLASGALLTGEALLAAAVWLRFVHHPHREDRVTIVAVPQRCALSLRF